MLKKVIASLLMAMGLPASGSGTTPVVLHIDGDGSHLAIADLDRYESFVGDWDQNDRLRKHLIAQAER